MPDNKVRKSKHELTIYELSTLLDRFLDTTGATLDTVVVLECVSNGEHQDIANISYDVDMDTLVLRGK